jgi:hypothetical protein
MGTAVTKAQVWRQWKESHRLALLAAFENSVNGTRVREFCKVLSEELGPRCRIIEHDWLFSTFRLRELREIAAEEASASDLIIISVQRAGELPEETKRWIELWSQRQVRRPAVLLALLDSDYDGAPTRVQTYLQDVARRDNMEFLVISKGESGFY